LRELLPQLTHLSAYVSIRQHTSAYVSIRQHTSAYVSIRPLPRELLPQLTDLFAHLLSLRHEGVNLRVTGAKARAHLRQHKSAYFSIRQHEGDNLRVTDAKARAPLRQQGQYLYFCTSKASKLSTCASTPPRTRDTSSSACASACERSSRSLSICSRQ
jgi:hypothetical protein